MLKSYPYLIGSVEIITMDSREKKTIDFYEEKIQALA